jgi:hypothetical protein
LVDNYFEDSVNVEVEERLDTIFKEDNNASFNKRLESYPDNYPLIELKSLVLSLEWEITDEVITDFLMHTNNLIKFYHDDKINLTFLQILRSLGKYIDKNRSKAHPDSIKILYSTFATFDHLIEKEQMPLSEKKQLLKSEVDKYNKLRRLIIGHKLSEHGEKNQSSIISTDSEIMKDEITDYLQSESIKNTLIISQNQFNELKNEIKQFIKLEFAILKNDLNNL